MQITDKDIQTFRERAKTELQSNGAVGRLAWDSVVDALCNEVEELRKNAAPGNAAALREAAERICYLSPTEAQDLRQLAQFCHDQSIYGGGLIERVLDDIEIVRQALSAPPEPPSNAAAMREALENARSKFIHIKKCADEGEVSRKKLAILCDFVSREITAALSAPPRNCDVGDAAEQSERLAKFCNANFEKAKKDKHICSECRFNDCPDQCPLEWAQLPFTPEKGGAE